MNHTPSFWELDLYKKSSDFLIVGGGFTGLNTAILLKESLPQAHVRVVDQNIHLCQASTKNAGFACFGSPSEILHDMSKMAEKDCLDLFQLRIDGIRNIKMLASVSSFSYQDCQAFEWFTKDYWDLFDKTAGQLDFLNKLLSNGDSHLYYRQRKKTRENVKEIEIIGEGQINPALLHNVLLKKAQNIGVDLISPFRVVEMNAHGVEGEDGIFLKSKIVINASNALTGLLSFEQDVKPARAQVVLTSELKNLPIYGNYHMNEGFYYFRNVGNRLLIGGGRHLAIEAETTYMQGINPEIMEELGVIIRNIIGIREPFNMTHKWSGIMGMRTDKLPRISDEKGVWNLAGMSGMGVALSFSLPHKLIDKLGI